MVDLAGSKENAYNIKWMKKKLKDRYKEHVNFVTADGKTTKVCFKDVIDYLIIEKWYKNKLGHKNDETQRIIITEAKLIMEGIRSKKYDSEYYPCKESMLRWMKHLNGFRLTSDCFCKTWLRVTSSKLHLVWQ